MGGRHLASAKLPSRVGRDRVNHPPQWLAMLASLPLGPVQRRGFGLLSPPAPRGQTDGPGHLLNNEEAWRTTFEAGALAGLRFLRAC
jgi:hypothetical protein